MTLPFKSGDEITIARGTYRNQTAIVVEASESKGQYAAKLADGTLIVVNVKNVRVPAEISISASALGEVLGAYESEISTEIFDALEAKVPGITDRVWRVQA